MSVFVSLDRATVAYPPNHRTMSLKHRLVSRYGQKAEEWHTVLKEITLSAGAGERIGVVGRNGAGKTTLLKLIAGILPPISGTCRAVGKIAPVIAQGLGFDNELSVRLNIRLALLHANRLEDWSNDLEARILEFCELEKYTDRQFSVLSSGMRSRLAFAISMFQSSDILILDEVFAAGDAAFVRKAQALTLKRVEDVPLLFFVSHTEDHLVTLCRRCILIDHGRLVMDGPTRDVLDAYKKQTVV